MFEKNKQTHELLRFYQNDTVSEKYHLPYENDKIPNVIQSENAELLQLFKVKILI